MKEAEMGWAGYYLDVCRTPGEAEAAYVWWCEQALEHPGAEVRVLRLPIGGTGALYCLVTQTRELVPPAVLKWHAELAEQLFPEQPGRQPFRRPDVVQAGPENSPPPVIFDRTSPTAWEKGVRTPEAWDAFMQRKGRKRRRA